MAVRTSYNATAHPDILWAVLVPILPSKMEVRGQVIGVGDKLIAYITDGVAANVVAFT